MTSFLDRYAKRNRQANDRAQRTRERQLETWGWFDRRQRGHVRTYANGWLGGLLKPPNDRRGRRHGMAYLVADVEEQFVERAVETVERRAKDERDEVGTVAELAAYVSGAWDSGGASYCATKTWYGSGLSDAFERLAAQLSPAERRAAEQNMRAALPPCRNCGCQQTKSSRAGTAMTLAPRILHKCNWMRV
jgi:hypothetical protein